MKLRDMDKGIHYVVIKGGSTLAKGDDVWLDEDGLLYCGSAAGWLNPSEWRRLRNEVVFNVAYYQKQIVSLTAIFNAKIKRCETLIEKHGERE